MNIGFIGTGVIATAIAHGIANDAHTIYITERSQANSAALTAAYSTVFIAEPQTICDQCDVVVVVCLMADTARKLLPTLSFRSDQAVFSVMVDITLADFSAIVEPAAETGVFIPFPFIAQGNSPLLVYPPSQTLEKIFGTQNHLVNLSSEADLNHYLAAQAVLLPTLTLLNEAKQWLIQRTDDAATAEKFLRILVGAYLTADDFDTAALDNMLRDLNTEGGLNAQLRDHFQNKDVYHALHQGLNLLETRLTN